MALVRNSCNKVRSVLSRLNVRFYSKTDLHLENDIKKSVFISQSSDVHANLALEEWLYKNFNFKNHHVLLLWQNQPCVIVGEHQNPWTETNFNDLRSFAEKEVALARRSGHGETLYQDEGSLNLSFFSPKEQFNSKYDMEVVARSIYRKYDCRVTLGAEEELLLRCNKQVSNRRAKLGKENACHTMSLMVRSNKVNRNMVFQKHDVMVNTITKSPMTSARMMNLCEENPQVTVPNLMKAIGWEFLRTKPLKVEDGGMELAHKQRGFQMVNPTENWFPGLNEIYDKHTSWDWCYGKTPKFNISQTFAMPVDLLHTNTGSSANLNVTMSVENGIISDIAMYLPYEINSLKFGFAGEVTAIRDLKGKRFSVEVFEEFKKSLDSLLVEKNRFVTDCVKQVMTCA